MNDDEDRIRKLIGEIAGRKRQGMHVSPAAAGLILAALRFHLPARQWLRAPMPLDPAPPESSEAQRKAGGDEGPLPTIGDMRRQGLVAVSITCEGPNCWNSRRVLFGELGLGDGVVFLDIPKWRGFRCSRCGCRRVRISPDWTDHAAAGNGRPLG